ncbi:MAG: transcription-repair coupling factor, partial [Clostridia bacterium]|nr:transcription-repair coupling factor [Clostridia bacterium]
KNKLTELLYENNLTVQAGRLDVVDGTMLKGVVYHDEKLAVVGVSDIFSVKQNKEISKKKKHAFFSAPQPGDYAVHEIHGVGKVIGTKRLTTGYGTKDYIAVEYKAGDILYVPVEQIDVLTKYVGSDKEPALSRIGGKDFERIKQRVKESLRALSFDLKELYKERSKKQGFVFENDDSLQELFDTSCGFEDTPDQITATEDVKKDMVSGKVMDRLICGDVGFGKTEVAFRAVFRAVNNGKQAVLLAPTTILAEQHYANALKRFEGFGVKIESLDRFKTKKEQVEVLDRLKDGKIDFIIGTHRLLSADVRFYDLGLLVLDEEQRFGVEHKEKIKLLKNNVDTMTLTATPIPRTLHMSLTGIRDISTINTPPKERLPVQTYVTEETDSLLADAISREVARVGQAFILYNRVETIYHFAEKLKALLPEVKFTVAHGQMNEGELEKCVTAFYRGETDVLIATTIIEDGIDLPKANTIIVIDADKLGLSTLYQLRGRVGRSNRLAHAYFTFKREKVLSDVAYKRLNTIMEFTEMGSGFKIAMRDLEIRGAGNILGVEQHGHMDKIGYELYSKLLKEEMEGKEEDTVLDIDAKITAFIPDDYIESKSGRLDCYKEIAEIESAEEGEELLYSLESAYGKVPDEVYNLIEIALVKRSLKRLGAGGFYIDRQRAGVTLKELHAREHQKLLDAIDKTADASISVTDGVSVNIARRDRTDREILESVSAFV